MTIMDKIRNVRLELGGVKAVTLPQLYATEVVEYISTGANHHRATLARTALMHGEVACANYINESDLTIFGIKITIEIEETELDRAIQVIRDILKQDTNTPDECRTDLTRELTRRAQEFT